MKARNLFFALMLVLLVTVAFTGSTTAGKPPPPTPTLTHGATDWTVNNNAMTIWVSDVAWSGVKPASVAFALDSTGPYGPSFSYEQITKARGTTSISYMQTPAMNLGTGGSFSVYVVLLDASGNELIREHLWSFSGWYLS